MVAGTNRSSQQPRARHSIGQSARQEWRSDDDPRLVDLYFATNREVKEDVTSSEGTVTAEGLTVERGDRLRFGVVRVHIPDDHKIGQIKLLGGISIFGWNIISDAIDAKKHFFIRSRQIVSREQMGVVCSSQQMRSSLSTASTPALTMPLSAWPRSYGT